jgi:flagellin-like protein
MTKEKSKKLLKQKKGLSGVIAVVILIALVLAATAIVWTFVQNLVVGKLDEAGSCLEVFDKISFNRGYTCYNSSSSELLFSINQGDLNLSQINIVISGGGTSKTIQLLHKNDSLNYIKYYRYGSYTDDVALPGANSGRTYMVNLTKFEINSKPDSIIIYPVVRKTTCQAIDSITQIDSCSLFSNLG